MRESIWSRWRMLTCIKCSININHYYPQHLLLLLFFKALALTAGHEPQNLPIQGASEESSVCQMFSSEKWRKSPCSPLAQVLFLELLGVKVAQSLLFLISFPGSSASKAVFLQTPFTSRKLMGRIQSVSPDKGED